MDPCTYMNIQARLAHYESMKPMASSRREVISLRSFLRSLLRDKIEGRQSLIMVPAQKTNG